MTRRVAGMIAALALAACGSKSDPPPPATIAASGERFGPLMMQIGHRLELAGRAAHVGRWELARYEVQELRELYEGPLLDAPAPPEIHARIEPFIDSCLAPLEAAAQAHDMTRFEAALTTTTLGCNACHATAGVPYIEIPSELGVEIPRMTPVSEASPEPTPPPATAAE
jgi:hypothetical protein